MGRSRVKAAQAIRRLSMGLLIPFRNPTVAQVSRLCRRYK